MIVFVLGFFMALGKAAVYKHIPVYYPKNVGAVGGLVGMIGGLGGFVLPIAFGALNDLTGLWTSCFMLLFVLVGRRAALDASRRSGRWKAASSGAALAKLPELPECRRSTSRSMSARCPAPCSTDWRPEDKKFWDTTGRAIARRNLWISIPALLLSFAVWQVWSVVVAKLPSVGFKLHDGPAVLARGAARALRRDAAHLLFLHGADLRRPAVDHARDLVADDPGGRHRLSPCRIRIRRTSIFLALALLCGFGGGNFASSMANISFFFPKAEKGNALALNAGLGNLGVSVVQFVVPIVITAGVFGWFGGEPQMVKARRRRRTALAAERRLHLGAVHRRQRVRRLVRHERHRLGQGLVRRAGGDLPAQAQLDHVLALHRHLRLVHRLFGGLPAAGQDPVPRRSNALQYVFLGPLVGALSRSLDRLGVRQVRRRPRHLLGVRRDDASASSACSTSSASRISRTRSGASSRCSCSCSSPPASATPRPSR